MINENGSQKWVVKYRPRHIPEIIDHVLLKKKFQGFVDKKNVPDMILTGPPGCGKSTFAECLVNDLYVTKEAIFYNVRWLNASDERGIGDIRELKDGWMRNIPFVRPVPFSILVCDEGEKMTLDAQDAFRGVFTEQKEVDVRFIFCTNNPGKIHEAIKSRAGVPIPVPRLSLEDVSLKLEMISKSENLSVEKGVFDVIYNYTKGDMRSSINLLQNSVVEDIVTKDYVSQNAGVPSQESIEDLLETCSKGDYFGGVKKMKGMLYGRGFDGRSIIKQLTNYFQNEDSQKKFDYTKILEIADTLGNLNTAIFFGTDDEVVLTSLIAKLCTLLKFG